MYYANKTKKKRVHKKDVTDFEKHDITIILCDCLW